MEYQKMINLLDDTTNQPSKFRKRNSIKPNDESKDVYSAGSEIKFQTLIIRSNLCDYSDTYIHVKAIITASNTATEGVAVNNTEKK